MTDPGQRFGSTALADRLERVTGNITATLAMGAAGRELAMRDFNLDTQSRRLQDLLLSGVNGAMKQAQDHMKEEMGKVTGGMNLPGMG